MISRLGRNVPGQIHLIVKYAQYFERHFRSQRNSEEQNVPSVTPVSRHVQTHKPGQKFITLFNTHQGGTALEFI